MASVSKEDSIGESRCSITFPILFKLIIQEEFSTSLPPGGRRVDREPADNVGLCDRVSVESTHANDTNILTSFLANILTILGIWDRISMYSCSQSCDGKGKKRKHVVSGRYKISRCYKIET